MCNIKHLENNHPGFCEFPKLEYCLYNYILGRDRRYTRTLQKEYEKLIDSMVDSLPSNGE